jgi:hypothetical protein
MIRQTTLPRQALLRAVNNTDRLTSSGRKRIGLREGAPVVEITR